MIGRGSRLRSGSEGRKEAKRRPAPTLGPGKGKVNPPAKGSLLLKAHFFFPGEKGGKKKKVPPYLLKRKNGGEESNA